MERRSKTLIAPAVLDMPDEHKPEHRCPRLPASSYLSKLILFGEPSLRRALTQFTEHYHAERNHQGKDNLLLFPSHDDARIRRGRTVACRERLGGLLKYYRRTA